MPYTQKERKLYRALVKQYGEKKAEQVYHAMLNSRRHEKVFGARSKREREVKRRKKTKAKRRKS